MSSTARSTIALNRPVSRLRALSSQVRELNGAIRNRLERVRFRQFEVVDLHLGKISVELILAVASYDPVVKRFGVGKELALVAIGRKVPGVEHNLDDLAYPVRLVSHR